MSIPFIDINSGEFLIIIVLALVLIGPKRLPGYLEKLRTWIRAMRDMAEGAKTQLKSEMGPEFQDIDWRQYDPRQYDPRKIVREALFDDPDADLGAELGLTERQPTGATAAGAMAAGAMGAGGATAATGTPTTGVGHESGIGRESGVGHEGATTGIGHETPHGTGIGGEETHAIPQTPRSHITAEYHPDRSTPFDVDAT